ncbi:unnamed protein product, partial [Gongylonema pulchrum]|uniref:Peptide-methionine (R)-S-oxide reductase n=1 Tax=Gongylonema pulchrum TaxID=637853 RepID=A0A183DKJ1_9BILA
METTTVSQEQFTSKKGERYPTVRPQDSDFLQGDGLFMAETHSASEYTMKSGERYDTVRPSESTLWK